MSIVDTALVYECPYTGELIIFHIKQAISIGSMFNNMFCVMQLRMNDIFLNALHFN